jgi:hypothetical protein
MFYVRMDVDGEVEVVEMDEENNADERTFEERVKAKLASCWTVPAECACSDCRYTRPGHVQEMVGRLGFTSHSCHMCDRHRAGVVSMERQLASCLCLSCFAAKQDGRATRTSRTTSGAWLLIPAHNKTCPCHPCAARRAIGLARRGEGPAISLLALLRTEDWRELSEEEKAEKKEQLEAEEKKNKKEAESKKFDKLAMEMEKKENKNKRKSVEDYEAKVRSERADTKRLMEEAKWRKQQEEEKPKAAEEGEGGESGVVDLTGGDGCGCDDCRFVTPSHAGRMEARLASPKVSRPVGQ